MKNKRFLLEMLVLTLVFGMMVVGCEEAESYPRSIVISVWQIPSWDYSTPTSGSTEISFNPTDLEAGKGYKGNETPTKVSVGDLQWLEASGINLVFSNAGGRSVSITSIEKRESGNSAIVKLNLTRSAEAPSGESGTATVLITLPNDFTAKYPDGITWGNKNFLF